MWKLWLLIFSLLIVNDNIFNRTDIDALYGISPKQLVRETNPIVIIDEPQSVDNTENAQQAIAALNPSMVFRFSATHKNKSLSFTL